MAKGSNAANSTITQAQQNSDSQQANSQGLYSSLAPQLESQLANPQGFTPTDEAAMQTGAQQSAGGSQAAAVGQGALTAARTRNAGSTGKAISDASRGAGEQLSKNLLGVQSANANLKQEQRGQALSGLEGLTNLETGAATSNLGLVAPLVNANTDMYKAQTTGAQDVFGDVLNGAKFLAGA